MSMGFNEGVFSPAETKQYKGWNPFGTPNKNPYPIFHSANPNDWDHESFFFWPEIQLINHPNYPNEPFKFVETKIDDYGPDIELNYVFDFIDRSKKADKPFFVFHAPHLGHLAKDCAVPGTPTVWPGTPELEWKDGKYIRKNPKHTALGGGRYKRENITPEGLSYHIEYLDYNLWQYVEKLKEIGELENTIIIFSADNGTQDNHGNFGKGHVVSQQGQHVPFLIYAPGVKNMVKGRQNICADFTDIVPTLAEIMGFDFPKNYSKLDGKSLWSYLTKQSKTHKEYIYSMRLEAQMIRNEKVMRDGYGTWYDVNKRAGNYDTFTKLDSIPDGEYKNSLLREKAKLEPQLAKYNLYDSASEAPEPPKDSDNDGIADWFEVKYGEMNPNDDLDNDGVSNYLEYIYGGDPKNPASPTKDKLPKIVEISDAQGTYTALQFQRREELGPDYWCLVEGSNDGKNWTVNGVVQQNSVRSNGDGTETVIARIAADKSKAQLKQLRVTVQKPVKRAPRKYAYLLKKN